MFILRLHARKTKDSRGVDTIEVWVNGFSASAPSGKSVGKHETPQYCETLDKSIYLINSVIIPVQVNSFSDLLKAEQFLCKSLHLKKAEHLGANALMALEIAILKALAASQNKALWQVINSNAKIFPVPMGNAVGGGVHSEQFINHPTFQEFLLIPQKKSFSSNVKLMEEIYLDIKRKLHARKVNDEGAWETEATEEEVLDTLFSYKDIKLGVDVAASTFYRNDQYNYTNKELKRKLQIKYVNSLIDKYKLFYVEDPVQQEDFRGFAEIMHRIPKTSVLAGDDLIVTNLDRIKKAYSKNSINAAIIKPNQNGSLIKVKEIIDYCRKKDIATIFSHRSGETMDDALADLAFGFQAGYIKCGIATPWRETKLKRLVEIEKSVKK